METGSQLINSEDKLLSEKIRHLAQEFNSVVILAAQKGIVVNADLHKFEEMGLLPFPQILLNISKTI